MNKAWRLVVGVLMTSCLTGCSLTHFVYNRADYFVAREVGKYLPLTAPQREALRSEVLDWQAWHRAEALPQWRTDADAMASALKVPFSEEDIVVWGQRIDGHVREALDQIMQRLVPLIATLNDEQIAAFWVSFDEAREARRDDSPNEAQAIKKRAMKAMRQWAGRPDDRQTALISEWADRYAAQWAAGGADLAAQDEARRREQVNVLLAGRGDADALARWRDFLSGDQGDDVEMSEAEADMVSLLASLSGSLSDRQRKRLIARVQHYAEMFAEMAVP